MANDEQSTATPQPLPANPGQLNPKSNDDGSPLWRLGRKTIIVMLAMVIVGLLAYTTDVKPDVILDTIIWLVGIGTGGIALEDGITKLRK
jgi:hypothetical protein